MNRFLMEPCNRLFWTCVAFLFLMGGCLCLNGCAGVMNTVRANVETIDFKASYGGATVRAGAHLREPEGFAK